MSNYLAIATVTATLKRLIQASVQMDVMGASVTTVRPDTSGAGMPEVGVNIFLYQVTPSLAWRNVDLRPRRPKGDLSKQAQAGLDLNYLFSFYGNETELQPQRLLGSTIRTLVDQPILTPEMIQTTLNSPDLDYLGSSDLVNQVERVAFAPVPMNTDELSKIWSVFLQTPYALSFAYQGSTVLLEGDRPGRAGLPLRNRQFFVTPNQPVIEQVVAEGQEGQGFVTTSTLLIRGRQLNADAGNDPVMGSGRPTLRGTPQVKLGDVQLTAEPVSDREVRLALVAQDRRSLRAGIQSLQLIFPLLPRSTPNSPERVIASNTIPITVSPTIVDLQWSNAQDEGDGLRSGTATVELDVWVSLGQRVLMVLNEVGSNQPVSYVLTAAACTEAVNRVVFPLREVKAGRYLVRVQVDGAESFLQVDLETESPTFEQYVGPILEIS